jgi:hypothetical protein
MSPKYDLLIKNGMLIDPSSRIHAPMDLAIKSGRIADVEKQISPDKAAQCMDASGMHVLPGIIDLHVHVASDFRARLGHRMLALAGVTCALDMSGPVEDAVKGAREYGTGLSIACVHKVEPGDTVSGRDPDFSELQKLTQDCLSKGAIGVKILGGHFPLTPEASSRAIRAAEESAAYVAYHAGSTATGSDLDGCLEAIELAEGRPLHLAHANSYCRGLKRTPAAEAEAVIASLKANPNICSEAYLSRINGTSAAMVNGKPASLVTASCLKTGGYEPTPKGMEAAILEGWAMLHVEAGGVVGLVSGQSALDFWRERQTNLGCSFRVNPPDARFVLASAKREDGSFVVDCISTDGGGIPRNSIVDHGLALVRTEALSIDEFAAKTSHNPARILGLENKGRLDEGADADISIVDLERMKPVSSIANGKLIMHQGMIFGSGSRFITTPAGEAYIKEQGLDPIVVDPARTPFLKMR